MVLRALKNSFQIVKKMEWPNKLTVLISVFIELSVIGVFAQSPEDPHCPAEEYPTLDFGSFIFPETKATETGFVFTSPCPHGFRNDGVEPIDPTQFGVFEKWKTTQEEQSGAKRICSLKTDKSGNQFGKWEPETNVTINFCRSASGFQITDHVSRVLLVPPVLNPLSFRQILPYLIKLADFAVTDYSCAETLVASIGRMLEDGESRVYANQLFGIIESYAMNAHIQPGYRVKLNHSKIAVETAQFAYDVSDVDEDIKIQQNVKDYTRQIDNLKIHLPGEAIQMSLNQKVMPRLKITAYSDDLFFHWKETASNNTTPAPIYNDSDHDVAMGNWRVLSVDLKGAVIENLTTEFEFTFFPEQNSTEGYAWRCVYWVEDERRWSSEGMRSIMLENAVICKSTHLTAFSVLIDPLPLPFPGSDYAPINNTVHAHILSILSSLGSALSIVGLAGTILTYGLFRCLRKERSNRILLSLSISLLFLHLMSISSSKNLWDEKCLIPSALLHYLLHTSLWWMLMEAHHMHQLLISVFVKPESRFLMKRSILAWGVPLIIVGICGGIHPEVYSTGRNDLCVIAAHLNLPLYYAAYLAPAVLILAVNFFVFCRIFKVLYRQTARQRKQSQIGPTINLSRCKEKEDWNQTTMDKIKSKTRYVMLSPTQIKGALTVMILVGVGWIVGFLAIGPFEVFFKYLFCICNAGQGAFIFFFRVVLHPQACRQWKKAILGFSLDSAEVSTTSSTSVSNKGMKKPSFSVSPTFISASNSVENSLTPSNPMAQDLAKTLASMLRDSEGQAKPIEPL